MFAGLLILASVAALSVQVEESELSGSLRDALVLELGASRVGDLGDLHVELLRAEDALLLTVRAADGGVVLQRRVEIAGGDVNAALRVAVVLIVRLAEGTGEVRTS